MKNEDLCRTEEEENQAMDTVQQALIESYLAGRVLMGGGGDRNTGKNSNKHRRSFNYPHAKIL